jgi:type II secretory pathway pseudopilin PulG
MRSVIVLLTLAATASAAWAQQPVTERERQLQLEQAQRDQALRAQQEAQRRIQRARENCIANHGVDCDTEQGLQEWLLLERTRAEAVLDRIIPPGSSSSGASSLPPGR